MVMLFSVQNREHGFTLTELLIAMAISGIVLGSLAGTFIILRKSFEVQEQITEMVQTARASIDMITREVRMAGYDPTGEIAMQRSDPTKENFVGIPYAADQLQTLADLNGDGETDGSITDDDKNENIIYKYYDEHSKYPYQIKRKTGKGYFQPFAENIKEFKFDYLEADGTTKVTTTADTGKIRQIKITITSRTAKADPDYSANNGFRTYTLTSLITPRNLAL